MRLKFGMVLLLAATVFVARVLLLEPSALFSKLLLYGFSMELVYQLKLSFHA